MAMEESIWTNHWWRLARYKNTHSPKEKLLCTSSSVVGLTCLKNAEVTYGSRLCFVWCQMTEESSCFQDLVWAQPGHVSACSWVDFNHICLRLFSFWNLIAILCITCKSALNIWRSSYWLVPCFSVLCHQLLCCWKSQICSVTINLLRVRLQLQPWLAHIWLDSLNIATWWNMYYLPQ